MSIDILKKILLAWDHLPEGSYSIKEVQDWLVNDMAPAIAKIREDYNHASKNTKSPSNKQSIPDTPGHRVNCQCEICQTERNGSGEC